MNFTDSMLGIPTALAYLLDHPAVSCVLILICLFLHQVRKSGKQKTEMKKLSDEYEKLKLEKAALELDAQVGKAFVTTIKALKN